MFVIFCSETQHYFCGTGHYFRRANGSGYEERRWTSDVDTARLYKTVRNAKIAIAHLAAEQGHRVYQRAYDDCPLVWSRATRRLACEGVKKEAIQEYKNALEITPVNISAGRLSI